MAKKWWILASVGCGTFMATLDSSIVNIALPTLTKELGTDLVQVKWVVIAYLLLITCLVLPFGRLADLYGRKLVFETGFGIFTLGSICCGLANTLGILVLSRAVQAVGASMLMANGPAIITSSFPSAERGKALGIMAMIVSAGLISGPAFGGLLVSHFGWKSIFLINAPFGILGAMLVSRFVSSDVRPKLRPSFDWGGTVLQALLMLSLIILFDPPQVSFSGGATLPLPWWAMLGVSGILTAAFIKVESEAKSPLLDIALLKNRTFWSANLASFFMFVAFSTVSVLMPFFLEEVMHLPTHMAGWFMATIPLTILFVAPIAGWLSDKFGSRELSFTGALITTIVLFAMGGGFGKGLNDDPEVFVKTSSAAVITALSSLGLAIGLFQSPNNNAIMSAVPVHKLGVASALLATVRNLGMVTGTGLATGIFAWKMEKSHHFVNSIHFVFLVAGCVGFGAMAAALARIKTVRELGSLSPPSPINKV